MDSPIAEMMLGAGLFSFIGDSSRSGGATGFQNTTGDKQCTTKQGTSSGTNSGLKAFARHSFFYPKLAMTPNERALED